MDRVTNDIKNRSIKLRPLTFIDDAIELTHISFVYEKIAYNFIKKGWINIELSRYSKAFKYFHLAYTIFHKKNNRKGSLLSKHGIASLYTKSYEYGKSLEIYFDILSNIKNNELYLEFIILKDIAMTYYSWKSYKSCLKYLKKAANIKDNQNFNYRKIFINYNLGKVYLKLGKLTKSQDALFMSLTICDANNINYKISESLTLLGNIFRKQQNFPRAESFHIRALQYAKSNLDYKSQINILINLGSMSYYAGKNIKGIQFIDSALKEIEHVNTKYSILLKANRYLFNMYKDLGNKDEALKYIQKLEIIKENENDRIEKLKYELFHLQSTYNIKMNSRTIKPENLNYKELQDEVNSLNSIIENETTTNYPEDLNDLKSLRDEESGLPRKSLFIEFLKQSINGTKRQKSKIAVFSIIVDFEFENKGIFLSEDLVIGEYTITNRLKDSIRSEDILGKANNDTYLLSTKMNNIRGCRVIAKKLISQIRNPIFTENQKIKPSSKIGITIYPDNYLNATELIERSTISAQKILKENLNTYIFSDTVHNITGID